MADAKENTGVPLSKEELDRVVRLIEADKERANKLQIAQIGALQHILPMYGGSGGGRGGGYGGGYGGGGYGASYIAGGSRVTSNGNSVSASMKFRGHGRRYGGAGGGRGRESDDDLRSMVQMILDPDSAAKGGAGGKPWQAPWWMPQDVLRDPSLVGQGGKDGPSTGLKMREYKWSDFGDDINPMGSGRFMGGVLDSNYVNSRTQELLDGADPRDPAYYKSYESARAFARAEHSNGLANWQRLSRFMREELRARAKSASQPVSGAATAPGVSTTPVDGDVTVGGPGGQTPLAGRGAASRPANKSTLRIRVRDKDGNVVRGFVGDDGVVYPNGPDGDPLVQNVQTSNVLMDPKTGKPMKDRNGNVIRGTFMQGSDFDKYRKDRKALEDAEILDGYSSSTDRDKSIAYGKKVQTELHRLREKNPYTEKDAEGHVIIAKGTVIPGLVDKDGKRGEGYVVKNDVKSSGPDRHTRDLSEQAVYNVQHGLDPESFNNNPKVQAAIDEINRRSGEGDRAGAAERRNKFIENREYEPS